MTRDLSNLSHDILRLIVGKVEKLKDFTSTCVVCSHWNRGIEWSDFVRPPLPRLMLPCSHGIGVGTVSRCPCQSRQSFSVMENKFYHHDLHEVYGKKCVGLSYGWLIMVEDTSPAVFMLNPLTKQRITLMPVTTMLPEIVGFEKEEVGREYIYRDACSGQICRFSLKDVEEFFVLKIILSNDHTEEEDCIAVGICGQRRRLVFCKIRHDNKWTLVQDLIQYQQDVVYSKGKFYVVNWNGHVGVFDVSNPQVTLIREAPNGSNSMDRMYLAIDTTGELLHISRYLHEDDDDDDDFYKTTEFNVFKLDEKINVWNKLRDVGNNIIFLGNNQSTCYSATEYPECGGDSIYFTDDYCEGFGLYEGHDTGIFDINKGLIEKIPCFKKDLSRIFPPPVWFTPSLRKVTLESNRLTFLVYHENSKREIVLLLL